MSDDAVTPTGLAAAAEALELRVALWAERVEYWEAEVKRRADAMDEAADQRDTMAARRDEAKACLAIVQEGRE